MNQEGIEELLLSLCLSFHCDCDIMTVKCESCKNMDKLVKYYKMSIICKELISPDV